MDERSEAVFNRFSQETQSRSRLEPHRDLILKLRKKGATYRRISKLLEEEFGLKTYYGTVYWFIKRRTGKKNQDEPEIEPAAESEVKTPIPVIVKRNIKYSPEEIEAMREAAKSSNHKPVFARGKVEEIFKYDPDRPLTNKPVKEKE